MVPLKYAQDSVLAYPSNCKGSPSYVCGVVWWVDAADREADDGDVVGVGVDLGGLAELGGGWAAQAEDEERCQQTTPHRGASSPTGGTWSPGPGNHEYIMWDRGPVSHVISNILGKLQKFTSTDNVIITITNRKCIIQWQRQPSLTLTLTSIATKIKGI